MLLLMLAIIIVLLAVIANSTESGAQGMRAGCSLISGFVSLGLMFMIAPPVAIMCVVLGVLLGIWQVARDLR